MEKGSIMSYLPEQQRIKLANLIRKLGEQTQQKIKYKSLYEKAFEDYKYIKQKYEKSEQHNMYLKAQISTSRLAISKAKQAFLASRSAEKPKRKIQDFEEQFAERRTQKNKLKYDFETPQEQFHSRMAKQQLKSYEQPNHRQSYTAKPPKKELLSSDRPGFGEQNSYMNQASNSRKQQIINIKQQIKQLTNSMKKKQRKCLPLSQKIRLSQEIRQKFQRSNQKKIIKPDEGEYESQNSSNQCTSEMEVKDTKTHARYQSHNTADKQKPIASQNLIGKNSAMMKSSKISKSRKFSSQKNLLFEDSPNNQQKQDVHPNQQQASNNYGAEQLYVKGQHKVSKKSHHNKQYRKESEQSYKNNRKVHDQSGKKDSWGKSSIMCKKNNNAANVYDESFYDIIKQLNGN